MVQIEQLDAAGLDREIGELTKILHACVLGGASVGFVWPFALEEARGFWTDKVAPPLAAGTRRLLVARIEGRVLGTVQLDLATPPNQRHRAEVAKLLVHPAARRRGLARALMLAVENVAQAEGRRLLTLDTLTGSAAEPLYLSLGYSLVGVIPAYAEGPEDDRLHATSIFFKALQGGAFVVPQPQGA
jgi:GNAT superfamily N-acetyltransferase